jgi:predicted ArsR family transcriptional regulator
MPPKGCEDSGAVTVGLYNYRGARLVPVDSRDREILEHLQRNGGADVQSLCDVLGVTRTAVRQRISRLEMLGLIAADLQGQTRGRPRNLYRVTAEGLHSLGENYRQLAVVFWEAITGLQDETVRNLLLSRIRDVLADRFRRQLTEGGSLDDRLDQLASEMKSSGFNIESQHLGGLRILRETSCPFPMLADVDESICQVEREVLEQVLGAPVQVRSRCRDGHGCCEFEVLHTPQG